ncbi:4Fe-4S dicluster domain-containing protein, partial [Candidatus Aminicenantes bacterium AC-335-L06]|nr:4Fe-4S dicluster domain-containing protein [Candidatus Aminicenantes bacterium AC-335-L06]
SGQDIQACYYCHKCVVGCPVSKYMDIPPNAILRMIQYGEKEKILKSATIWLCTACETCGTRCPNNIDIAKVMDVLKQMAVKEGVKGKEKTIQIMHKAFLAGIEKRGRMHELSLIRDLKLRSGGLFKDIKLGIKMFQLGKFSIFPEKVRNVKEIKKIFKKIRSIE